MKDTAKNHISIFPVNVYNAIQKEKEVSMQFAIFNDSSEALFLKILRRFLACYDLLYLKDILYTILKELITNAVKANAKRLYFHDKGLNINNKSDYMKGMENFKHDVILNKNGFLPKLANTDFHVKIIFQKKDNNLQIKIINNIAVIREEIAKIKARIKKAYKYNNITDAFNDVLDDSEGAGLGLIMAIMIFKNAGFSPDNFKMNINGSNTITELIIPINKNLKTLHTKLTDNISRQLKLLPTFPENINQIKLLCENNESTISQISKPIKRDPGLSTSILKLANSAGYITSNRVNTIENAVKIIGLQGIKNLVTACVVENIIKEKHKEFKQIWEKSYKKAFYAQRIAKINQNNSLAEISYLSALISDIGKIILLSIKKKDIHNIIKLSGIKEIHNADILQEITLGISQTTLGAIISKKWQFDDLLSNTIEYYLRPYIAPKQYKNVIYIVHLAHVLIEIERNSYRFEIIDDDVLNYFNIKNKTQFNNLHNILKNEYSTLSM